jgi:hypothetical protein
MAVFLRRRLLSVFPLVGGPKGLFGEVEPRPSDVLARRVGGGGNCSPWLPRVRAELEPPFSKTGGESGLAEGGARGLGFD